MRPPTHARVHRMRVGRALGVPARGGGRPCGPTALRSSLRGRAAELTARPSAAPFKQAAAIMMTKRATRAAPCTAVLIAPSDWAGTPRSRPPLMRCILACVRRGTQTSAARSRAGGVARWRGGGVGRVSRRRNPPRFLRRGDIRLTPAARVHAARPLDELEIEGRRQREQGRQAGGAPGDQPVQDVDAQPVGKAQRADRGHGVARRPHARQVEAGRAAVIAGGHEPGVARADACRRWTFPG